MGNPACQYSCVLLPIPRCDRCCEHTTRTLHPPVASAPNVDSCSSAAVCFQRFLTTPRLCLNCKAVGPLPTPPILSMNVLQVSDAASSKQRTQLNPSTPAWLDVSCNGVLPHQPTGATPKRLRYRQEAVHHGGTIDRSNKQCVAACAVLPAPPPGPPSLLPQQEQLPMTTSTHMGKGLTHPWRAGCEQATDAYVHALLTPWNPPSDALRVAVKEHKTPRQPHPSTPSSPPGAPIILLHQCCKVGRDG